MHIERSAEKMKPYTVILASLLLAGGCAPSAGIHADHAAVDVTRGANRLLIRTYGEPPKRLGRFSVRGSGLQGIVLNQTRKDPLHIGGGSEAEPDVTFDYSDFSKGIIRTTDYAWDLGNGPQIPFVLTTHRIDANGNAQSEEKLILVAERANDERVRDLVAEALSSIDSRGPGDPFADTLVHLRNIAVDDPGRTLKAYEQIRKQVAKRYNAASSESLSEFKADVERIQTIRRAQQVSAPNDR